MRGCAQVEGRVGRERAKTGDVKCRARAPVIAVCVSHARIFDSVIFWISVARQTLRESHDNFRSSIK